MTSSGASLSFGYGLMSVTNVLSNHRCGAEELAKKNSLSLTACPSQRVWNFENEQINQRGLRSSCTMAAAATATILGKQPHR